MCIRDRIISGYVGLAIIDALPENLTANARLPKSAGLKRIILPLVGVLIGAVIILLFLAITK